MYIENTNGYYVGAEQRVGRANFLFFLHPERQHSGEIKCVVRKVALRQFGHWMMGRARIGGESVTISGSYGGDGLPLTVSDDLYDAVETTLPQELYDAWNKGGGHNSAGSEAPAVLEWANKNLKAMTAKLKVIRPQLEWPNLEGSDDDEVLEFLSLIQTAPKTVWLRSPTKDPYSSGAKILSGYRLMTSHLLDARRSRRDGHIDQALYLEKLVDDYYKDLPEFMKW